MIFWKMILFFIVGCFIINIPELIHLSLFTDIENDYIHTFSSFPIIVFLIVVYNKKFNNVRCFFSNAFKLYFLIFLWIVYILAVKYFFNNGLNLNFIYKNIHHFIYTALIIPFMEEIIFRPIFVELFEEKISKIGLITFGSFCFIFLHLFRILLYNNNNYIFLSTFNTFVCSIIGYIIFLKHRNPYLIFYMHVFWNLHF